MKPIILGGGIAGLSLAYFLDRDSIVLEKEEKPGGLCRSFEFNQVVYDAGPHTIFSKNKETLGFLTSLAKTNFIKRSNKIYHKGRLIRYPFAYDLASLNDKDREYCLREFLHNPYKNCRPKNALEFFLKTFGKGITELHLRPYNKKIWKVDPSSLDVSITERIPKPLKEDIIKSARIHQLDAYYPDRNGFQEIISAFLKLIAKKSEVIYPVKIKRIYREKRIWQVETDKGIFISDSLINCMPLPELFKFVNAPKNITEVLNELKYNSLYIVAVQAKRDRIGNNFALYFADKDIIFNRISKLNFLGKNYCPEGNTSTVLAEITYKPKSRLAGLKKEEVQKMVVDDLDKLDLIKKRDIIGADFRNFEYAYVIYDLNHRKNAGRVLEYLSGIGIRCCGRSAEFEYLDMDAVVEHSRKLAKKLNDSFD